MVHQRIVSVVLRNARSSGMRRFGGGKALRVYSSSSPTSAAPTSATAPPKSSQSQVNANVPGLSDKCLQVPNAPVGPGASHEGEYKVPEYFCYDKTSYFEAEIEMLKYRLPTPSSKS